jgi:2-amino-4-hydroxy-6-hydroxymethyldihydropteridine diphosphokinase
MEGLAHDLVPRFRAIVALGGNLGAVHMTMQEALRQLSALPWTSLEAVSQPFVSSPVDAFGPDFLNAVAVLQTALAPLELLHALQAIEQAQGRERPSHHAPRTLDLDLIWVDTAQRDTPELTLPHPRWHTRAFVLEPMAQVLAQSLTTKAAPWPNMPSLPERLKIIENQPITAHSQPFLPVSSD